MSKEQTLSDLMEQHVQAKVLEALEREVPKAHFKGSEMVCRNANIGINDEDEKALNLDAKEYYETKVKPNYYE